MGEIESDGSPSKYLKFVWSLRYTEHHWLAGLLRYAAESTTIAGYEVPPNVSPHCAQTAALAFV